MANRTRYKDIERILTMVLLGNTAVFALYLLFAGLGIVAMKVITAIIAIVASVLCLVYLHMCGETKKARSRWLVMGFAAIGVCLLISLILNFPAPAVKAIADVTESIGVG